MYHSSRRGLAGREASVQIPDQASPTKRNITKYFFGDFLSTNI